MSNAERTPEVANATRKPESAPSSCSDQMVPSRMSWRRWSLSHRRLRGEVIAVRSELHAQIDADDSEYSKRIAELIALAATQARDGEVSVGFEALNAARQQALSTFSSEQLTTEALALLAEVESEDVKFSQWRREGIRSILAPFRGDDPIDVNAGRVLVAKALQLRDDGAQNTHRRLELVSRRYWQLLAVTLVAVAILVLLSWSTPLDVAVNRSVINGRVTELTLADWSVWLHAFVLGVIGACVSAGLSLSKQTFRGRVPDLRGQTTPAVFRPAFGGAAAIGALGFLAAGLLAGLTASTGTVVSIAFLAGFSERLLNTVSRSVE